MYKQTQYNYSPKPGFVSNLPHLTVPDEVMTVRQIYDRHVRGMPVVGNTQEPTYEDENDYILDVDPKTLDLSEIADLKDYLSEQINDAKNKAKNEAKTKQKEQYEENLKKRFQNETQSQ